MLDGLKQQLEDAVTSATIKLDSLTSEGSGDIVVRVSLDVRDRVITSADDVEAQLDEIRQRLLTQLEREGQRVRLRLS